MNIEALLGGAQGSFAPWHQALSKSQVFTAPFDGWFRFYVIGAGGAGAAAVCDITLSSSPSRAVVTGGGGGGYVERTVFLSEGDEVTVVLGSGGIATASDPGISESLSGKEMLIGHSGGETTLTGPDVSITVPGGYGGGIATTEDLSSNWVVAGRGRLPTGGDINRAGGDGGTIAQVHGDALKVEAFGGGACPIVGTDEASVSALVTRGIVPQSVPRHRYFPAASVYFGESLQGYLAGHFVPMQASGSSPGEPGCASAAAYSDRWDVAGLQGGLLSGGGCGIAEASSRWAHGGTGGVGGGGGAASSPALGRGGSGGDAFVFVVGVRS